MDGRQAADGSADKAPERFQSEAQRATLRTPRPPEFNVVFVRSAPAPTRATIFLACHLLGETHGQP